MSVRAYRDIIRRKSRKIRVGSVEVGGDAPISVQSMTNTVTSDARSQPSVATWPRLASIPSTIRPGKRWQIAASQGRS